MSDKRMPLEKQDKSVSLVRSDRAFRQEQIRKRIYADIARSLRKAARSYHLMVDGCARATWKRGGIVDCPRCNFYFKFTAEDAEELLKSRLPKE